MNPRRPVRTVDRHASENHSHTANDSPPPPHPISDPQSGSGTGTRVAAVALGAVGLCVRGYFYAGWTLRTGFARSREPRLATSSVNFTATAAELAAYHSRVDAIHYALSELLAPSSVLSMDGRFRWACTADLTPHGTRGCVVPSTLWELRRTVAHSAAALAARWARRRRAERYLGVAHAGSPDQERGRYPISPCSPLSPRSAPPSSPPSLPPATPPPRRAAISSPQIKIKIKVKIKPQTPTVLSPSPRLAPPTTNPLPPPRPPPPSHPSTPSPPPVSPPLRFAAVSSPQTPSTVAPSGAHLRLRPDLLPLSMMEPISRVLFPTDETFSTRATPGLLDPAPGFAERRALSAALRAWYVWVLSTSPNVLKRLLLWWNRRMVRGGWLAWRRLSGSPTFMATTVVPMGAVPGQMLNLTTPNGAQVSVAVRAGAVPGQTIVFQYTVLMGQAYNMRRAFWRLRSSGSDHPTLTIVSGGCRYLPRAFGRRHVMLSALGCWLRNALVCNALDVLDRHGRATRLTHAMRSWCAYWARDDRGLLSIYDTRFGLMTSANLLVLGGHTCLRRAIRTWCGYCVSSVRALREEQCALLLSADLRDVWRNFHRRLHLADAYDVWRTFTTAHLDTPRSPSQLPRRIPIVDLYPVRSPGRSPAVLRLTTTCLAALENPLHTVHRFAPADSSMHMWPASLLSSPTPPAPLASRPTPHLCPSVSGVPALSIHLPKPPSPPHRPPVRLAPLWQTVQRRGRSHLFDRPVAESTTAPLCSPSLRPRQLAPQRSAHLQLAIPASPPLPVTAIPAAPVDIRLLHRPSPLPNLDSGGADAHPSCGPGEKCPTPPPFPPAPPTPPNTGFWHAGFWLEPCQMAAGALPLSCDVCDSPIGIFPQVSGGGGCTPPTQFFAYFQYAAYDCDVCTRCAAVMAQGGTGSLSAVLVVNDTDFGPRLPASPDFPVTQADVTAAPAMRQEGAHAHEGPLLVIARDEVVL